MIDVRFYRGCFNKVTLSDCSYYVVNRHIEMAKKGYNPEQVNNAGGWWSNSHKSNTWVVARQMVEKYNNILTNPIGQVGTGSYIIKDYVPGSSLTCTANPDYWSTDPCYPCSKLSYIDTIITTFIPDPSTRIAALRTGRLYRLRRMRVTMSLQTPCQRDN